LFLLLTTSISASSFSPPPLFCKCTCGTNSTIIPLDEPPHTCADCTRSFCLGYNLPFCKGVQKEEDVATSCFARDGLMDRVLVWGFVIVTVGLLVWAGIRGW
ncbi:hypothetical protein L211DRAFT_769357, partial [Terfezia boudieri ATCC MYA-4762]